MTRVLGIDLGERRIGLATGDPETRTATPFATLHRARTAAADAAAIARIATDQGVSALVIGLPIGLDGSEGAQAERTRGWAVEIGRETGLPVALHDERLTSVRAERRVGGPPRGRNGGPPTGAQREAYRARIDREAAALILQDAFDAAGPSASNLTSAISEAATERAGGAPVHDTNELTSEEHEVQTR